MYTGVYMCDHDSVTSNIHTRTSIHLVSTESGKRDVEKWIRGVCCSVVCWSGLSCCSVLQCAAKETLRSGSEECVAL